MMSKMSVLLVLVTAAVLYVVIGLAYSVILLKLDGEEYGTVKTKDGYDRKCEPQWYWYGEGWADLLGASLLWIVHWPLLLLRKVTGAVTRSIVNKTVTRAELEKELADAKAQVEELLRKKS